MKGISSLENLFLWTALSLSASDTVKSGYQMLRFQSHLYSLPISKQCFSHCCLFYVVFSMIHICLSKLFSSVNFNIRIHTFIPAKVLTFRMVFLCGITRMAQLIIHFYLQDPHYILCTILYCPELILRV